MHVWAQFQSLLEGLDGGQAGQSGTDTRGDTDPQSSSRFAATLQR